MTHSQRLVQMSACRRLPALTVPAAAPTHRNGRSRRCRVTAAQLRPPAAADCNTDNPSHRCSVSRRRPLQHPALHRSQAAAPTASWRARRRRRRPGALPTCCCWQLSYAGAHDICLCFCSVQAASSLVAFARQRPLYATSAQHVHTSSLQYRDILSVCCIRIRARDVPWYCRSLAQTPRSLRARYGGSPGPVSRASSIAGSEVGGWPLLPLTWVQRFRSEQLMLLSDGSRLGCTVTVVWCRLKTPGATLAAQSSRPSSSFAVHQFCVCLLGSVHLHSL